MAVREWVRMSHPDVEGTALVPDTAVKHHEKSGWGVVSEPVAEAAPAPSRPKPQPKPESEGTA